MFVVGENNRAVQTTVHTGRRRGGYVEIVDGMKADDSIVTSGAAFLSDGDLVRVTSRGPGRLTPAGGRA